MIQATIAVTQFEVRCGSRHVSLVRRTLRCWPVEQDAEAERFVWDLYDPITKSVIATWDDSLLPSAQQAAVRYLDGQMEVERMRAEADAAEGTVLSEFRRPDDCLNRARHFRLEDLPT